MESSSSRRDLERRDPRPAQDSRPLREQRPAEPHPAGRQVLRSRADAPGDEGRDLVMPRGKPGRVTANHASPRVLPRLPFSSRHAGA